MTIRMGYWDCPSCGHKRIEGPNAACVNCGVPRGPKIPFYTDDSAPVIEDPELVARARAGADWTCKYCKADNRAGMMDCHQCGSGPDGSVRRGEQFIAHGAAPMGGDGRQYGQSTNQAGNFGGSVPMAAQQAQAQTLAQAQAAANKKRGMSVGLIAGIAGGALLLVSVLVWALFLRTTAVPSTITAAVWTKTVAVEKLETTRGSAWADEVPSGARTVKTETRGRMKTVQDGTERVKTGKRDLGNGMFEDVYEDRPKMVKKNVDDRWVTYEKDNWKQLRKDKKESTNGTEPPDPWTGSPGAGQRFGAKTNGLVLKMKGGGDELEYEINLEGKNAAAIVAKYKVGGKVTAKVNTLGGVNDIE